MFYLFGGGFQYSFIRLLWANCPHKMCSKVRHVELTILIMVCHVLFRVLTGFVSFQFDENKNPNGHAVPRL